MKHLGLTIIATSSLFIPLVSAQLAVAQQDEAATTAQEVTPAQRLAEAVKVVMANDALLSATVSHDDADQGDPMGGRAMVVTIGVGGNPADPFVGDLEIFRSKNAELLISSKVTLPSVAYYDDGDVALTETLFGSEPVGTADLTQDLSQLLDLDRLSRAIGKAECKSRVNEETHVTTISGSLSRRFIKGSGGIAASFNPRILEVDFIAKLDADGKFASVDFDVVRSNPMTNLQERIGASGGVQIGSMPDLTELESDDEGRTTTYAISVAEGKISRRGAEVLARMREAAAIEGKR